MAVIGIDLGTTNSLGAVWTEKGPELIPNALGQPLTPSVVGLDEDGSILVGQAAVERLITHPELTVADFKRRMGSEQPTKLGSREFRPEELSAMVLRSLKADAEAKLGTIDEAIISVPAYFNDAQRKATLNAGQLAGLKVERLINEPTAAALAYGLNEGQGTQFLIFDLGGGTFDVSILDRYENVMEVRATAGDNFLGGNDFREGVAALIARKCGLKAADLNPRDRNQLIRAAERAKLELSRGTEAEVAIQLASGPVKATIGRVEFETEVEAQLRRLRLPLERAISDARLKPVDIHSVVLVGGATRMPMVRRLVARLFGKLPLTHLDPDQIVALGAAVQAGLKTRNKALEDVVMTDVCPYTLGVAVRAQGATSNDELVMSPIIERNAVVPVSRAASYSTIADWQASVRLKIYQGENLRPHNNALLGEIDVEVPKAKAGEQPIEVRFTYDINGALEVEAKVVKTGRLFARVFKNQANLSDEDLKRRFAELESIKMHPREKAENRALIARAERIWAECLGERRDIVGGLIREFEAAIGDQHMRDQDQLRRQFAEALDGFDRPLLPGDA